MRKHIQSLFGAFILLLVANVAMAAQFDSKDPYKLIQNVADDTFSHLKENQKKYQANPDLLKEVAKVDILPYINVRYAALKILGPFARKTSKQERDEFTDAFTDYLVSLYAQILIRYTDQKVTVEPPKPIDADRSIVSVRVEIIDTKRPPINLDFKLRKNKKTGDWQGYDVQVEGVSMLDTKAAEWQKDLRNNGVAYVTNQFKELANTPIKEKASKS